ncbi:MAG: hypothetical protein U1F56_17120 [Rubrivivax sp.]
MSAELLIVVALLAAACGALAWGWRRERHRLGQARARLRDSERLRAELLRQNAELRRRLAASSPRPAAAPLPAPVAPAVSLAPVDDPAPDAADDTADAAPAFWEETRPVLPSDELPAFVRTQPNGLQRHTGA